MTTKSHWLLAVLLMLSTTYGIAQTPEPTEITYAEALNYYKSHSKRRVTCHDPSVVWDHTRQRYYIFGSHLAEAWSADLQNWTTFKAPFGAVLNDSTIQDNANNAQAFSVHQVKHVTIGGKEVPFGNYNAHDWAAAYGGDYNIDGNLWAPDVIYNKAMQKWCMYMSVNGPEHNSVIVLLTSDKIDGTYVYQGPVVFTGFKNGSDERISWKKTDLELVIGEQATLPSRYAHPNDWGDYWANGIDPCVFYDETGRLWMSYGSWSGGIWMLELDEETGLRDYNITYGSDYSTKGKSTTKDPYFGKKIAGGYYASGEASYIEYIGGYYYLFMSYGKLESTGGYQMRVFRSKNPDGPYVDSKSRSAIFSNWALNFGPNADTRGQLIMGAYGQWGFMGNGELAQGHNSVIAAPDGRSYLVYHTRFDDGSEGHQVRVHQLYTNSDGWLVASPFEYNGGTLTDSIVATNEILPDAHIPGTYHLLVHRYALDHKNRQIATPVKVELHPDGKLSGAYTGSWSRKEGTGYITIKLGNVAYEGVILDEQMDGSTIRTITFTACAASGVHIWGYKMRPDYALAYQLKSHSIPVSNGQTVSTNLNLSEIPLQDNVDMAWSSSHPHIISTGGKYNPTGLEESVEVDLNAHFASANYYTDFSYTVKAAKETIPTQDWSSGIVAYYNFDSDTITNAVTPSQRAFLMKNGNASRPTQEQDSIRNGRFVHLHFGANGNESYVSIPNPFYKKEITEGLTLSFWLRRADNNVWDGLFAFHNTSSNARLYMTGGTYIGYNSGAGNWIDINHPNSFTATPIGTQQWHLVTVTIGRATNNGVKIYIDGTQLSGNTCAGHLDGSDITRPTAFDNNLIADHIVQCPKLTLGLGSFWGSPDVCIDDLIIYDRILSRFEIGALKQMMNRVYDMAQTADIDRPVDSTHELPTDDTYYDLSGRPVLHPTSGIYIKNGKKIIIK